MSQPHCPAEVLSAHLEGDLDARAQHTVTDHLSGCAECREVLAELRALPGDLGGFVSPPRDLWPAIAKQLDAPRPGWGARLRALVALPVPAWSLAAAVAAALLVVGVPRLTAPPAASAAHAEVDRARAQYKKAIARLESASTPALRTLDPAAREKVAQGLALVDKSIDECEAALARAPQDSLGQEMLLALYDEKLRVLNAVLDAADREVTP